MSEATEVGLEQRAGVARAQAADRALIAHRAVAAARAAVLAAEQRAAEQRAAEQRAAAQRAAAAREAAAQAAAHPKTSSPPVTSAPAEPSGSPQQIAMAMLGDFGWSSSQFGCLDSLWEEESGWNPEAENASGAYGIPQALPGSKMASAGADWETDPATQIRWGLGYIQGTYGSPCGAWDHETAYGWY
jgi:hypothetical protein